ncbi:hypothetical protein FRC07_007213 [Ceratobasidium sp. 392]|nr:hypothetical protein FRC07_007213 [Ceratobasidium sp. 392]
MFAIGKFFSLAADRWRSSDPPSSSSSSKKSYSKLSHYSIATLTANSACASLPNVTATPTFRDPIIKPLDDWASIDSSTPMSADIPYATFTAPITPNAPRISHAAPVPHLGPVAFPPSSIVQATSTSRIVSHDNEDCRDDSIVETILSTESSSPIDSTLTPTTTLAPLADPTPPHNAPISSEDPCTPLEHIYASNAIEYDTIYDDRSVCSSDTITQDDFYAAEDHLYAVQNGLDTPQDSFHGIRADPYTTDRRFYATQTNAYAPQGILCAANNTQHTTVDGLDAISAKSSSVLTTMVDERPVNSYRVWKGGRSGELQPDTQAQGNIALGKWTFANDGLTNIPVAGRMEGDIHFSPSTQHKSPGESFLSWACVLNLSGIPEWLALSDGYPHPLHKGYVFKPAEFPSTPPQWLNI